MIQNQLIHSEQWKKPRGNWPGVSLEISGSAFRVTMTYCVALKSEICIGCYSATIQSLRTIRELASRLFDYGVITLEHPDSEDNAIFHVLHLELPTGPFREMFAKLDVLVKRVDIAVFKEQSETEATISNIVEEV